MKKCITTEPTLERRTGTELFTDCACLGYAPSAGDTHLMRNFVFFFLCASTLCSAQPASGQQDNAYQYLQQEQLPVRKGHRLVKASVVPLALISAGAFASLNHTIINRYEIKEERDEHFAHFRTNVDDYLMYAPAAIVYGLNLAGVKGRNDLRNRTLLLLKTEVMTHALTFSLKSITHELRPDGSDHQSFPSGHTAQAFATATFLAKEYGDQSLWYSIGAYGMATTVGAMRVLNNRHWVSDVFAGAGIGILSTNIIYLTHRYRWKNKNSRLTLIPSYNKGPGLYASIRLK